MAASSAIFSPSSEAASAIVHALIDPTMTLMDIAATHDTSLDGLTLWMASDDAQKRILDLQSALAARARLAATAHLPTAVETLHQILLNANDEESHVLVRPGSVLASEQRRRARETARRASTLLLRIARFFPASAPPASVPRVPHSPPDRTTSALTQPAHAPATVDLTALLAAIAASIPPQSQTDSAPPDFARAPIPENKTTNTPTVPATVLTTAPALAQSAHLPICSSANLDPAPDLLIVPPRLPHTPSTTSPHSPAQRRAPRDRPPSQSPQPTLPSRAPVYAQAPPLCSETSP